MCASSMTLGLHSCPLDTTPVHTMQLDPQTLELVVQIISTAGLSIAGVRGLIAALTSRIATIEADVADLRARYARVHPQSNPQAN